MRAGIDPVAVGDERVRPRLLPFRELRIRRPEPRVLPKRLHPGLYRFVAVGDLTLSACNLERPRHSRPSIQKRAIFLRNPDGSLPT